MKKIIAVFTGNRAEYGLQYPVLKAIDAHPDLDYRLMVSGAHLEKDFGQTIKEIEMDGFTIHNIVEIYYIFVLDSYWFLPKANLL